MPWSHLPPLVSALFYALAHCLDRRLRGRFPQLLIGVLFARGRRTCTAWFRACGIADDFRQAYHAAHAAGRHADFLATQVLPVVRPLQPGRCLAVALDGTPTPRWGPHAEGAGLHHNPTPGPAGEKYVYGHVRVTLAALVRHPDGGGRALPLHSALYVRAKDVTPELARQGWSFRAKPGLAGQQLRWRHAWAAHAAEAICAVADGAYAKRPLLRVVRQPGTVMVSRLPKNAAPGGLPPTRRPPGRRGPLPTYGKERLDPARRAGQRRGRQPVECVLYRQRVHKTVKTFVATWRPAGGAIRVVLVDEPDGWRAYFSTDPAMAARQVLEPVADRTALEQTFKDLKEVWGAGQQQLRDAHASVGAFNANGWLYTAVEAWAWQRGHEQLVDRRASPWDRQDRGPSHADKRKALQREVVRAETQALLGERPGGEGSRDRLEQLLGLALP